MRERSVGKGASRGEESVLADAGREGAIAGRGRAGEKSDCFSILLGTGFESEDPQNNQRE